MRIVRRLGPVMLGSCLAIGLIGCAHPAPKVLDPCSDPVRLPKGTNWTAVTDGYFVPDATMLRILDHLSEQDVWGTNRAPASR